MGPLESLVRLTLDRSIKSGKEVLVAVWSEDCWRMTVARRSPLAGNYADSFGTYRMP